MVLIFILVKNVKQTLLPASTVERLPAATQCVEDAKLGTVCAV